MSQDHVIVIAPIEDGDYDNHLDTSSVNGLPPPPPSTRWPPSFLSSFPSSSSSSAPSSSSLSSYASIIQPADAAPAAALCSLKQEMVDVLRVHALRGAGAGGNGSSGGSSAKPKYHSILLPPEEIRSRIGASTGVNFLVADGSIRDEVSPVVVRHQPAKASNGKSAKSKNSKYASKTCALEATESSNQGQVIPMTVTSTGDELSGATASNSTKPASSQEESFIEVVCGTNTALLSLSRLAKGTKVSCVLFQGSFMTPNQFQHASGRGTARDWKRSIKHGGCSLKVLLTNQTLTLSPPHCKCKSCQVGSEAKRQNISTNTSSVVPAAAAAAVATPKVDRATASLISRNSPYLVDIQAISSRISSARQDADRHSLGAESAFIGRGSPMDLTNHSEGQRSSEESVAMNSQDFRDQDDSMEDEEIEEFLKNYDSDYDDDNQPLDLSVNSRCLMNAGDSSAALASRKAKKAEPSSLELNEVDWDSKLGFMRQLQLNITGAGMESIEEAEKMKNKIAIRERVAKLKQIKERRMLKRQQNFDTSYCSSGMGSFYNPDCPINLAIPLKKRRRSSDVAASPGDNFSSRQGCFVSSDSEAAAVASTAAAAVATRDRSFGYNFVRSVGASLNSDCYTVDSIIQPQLNNETFLTQFISAASSDHQKFKADLNVPSKSKRPKVMDASPCQIPRNVVTSSSISTPISNLNQFGQKNNGLANNHSTPLLGFFPSPSFVEKTRESPVLPSSDRIVYQPAPPPAAMNYQSHAQFMQSVLRHYYSRISTDAGNGSAVTPYLPEIVTNHCETAAIAAAATAANPGSDLAFIMHSIMRKVLTERSDQSEKKAADDDRAAIKSPTTPQPSHYHASSTTSPKSFDPPGCATDHPPPPPPPVKGRTTPTRSLSMSNLPDVVIQSNKVGSTNVTAGHPHKTRTRSSIASFCLPLSRGEGAGDSKIATAVFQTAEVMPI